MPRKDSQKPINRAFTLVEVLATIAIVAMLVAGAIVVIPSFIAWAKTNSDKQTYTVLNDALTRYKTEGGSVSALTASSDIGSLLTKLKNGVTWGNRFHQFLGKGVTYPARSISATGAAAQYRFTRYNTYNSTDSSSGGETVTHGVESFTSVGSTTWTVPAGITTVEVLLVGGGGGGGTSAYNAGGGGAGGSCVYNASYAVTAGNTINVVVGGGGSGGIPQYDEYSGDYLGWQTLPEAGTSSAFGALTANGGARGLNGDEIYDVSEIVGGDGAGASHSGLNGGAGLQFSISGSPTYYGGGGGGFYYSVGWSMNIGDGGLGGGASGSSLGGTNGLGGGGGGQGSNGGSGIIVIVKW